MRVYTIKRVEGSWNWRDVPELEIDTRLWTDPIDIRAHGQIAYDAQALHVRLWAQEAEVRAEHTGPIDMPCEDSCLEFFFCPIPGDARYFNIEFNPNACMYLGMGTGIEDLVRLLPGDAPFAPEARRRADGWEIEYRVPYAFVRRFFPGFEVRSGLEIRANCFKCGDRTPRPHFFSWNPVTSETPAFHRTCDFGCMRFE